MNGDPFQVIRSNGANTVVLLRALGDLELRDEDGQTLLHESASSCNHDALDYLIARGVDMNVQESDGQTALHFAAVRRDARAVRALLAAGADPTIVDIHGNSPLWAAVVSAHGDYEAVRTLYERSGTQLAHRKNKHGMSPYDFAAQIDDDVLLRLLSS